MKKKVIFLILIALPIVVGIFLYVAGLFYLIGARLSLDQLTPLTYIHVGQELSPSHPLYEKWVNAGKVAGLSITLLIAFLIYKLTELGESDIYGKAKFASLWDLKSAGLLSPSDTAVVVGRIAGRYIYLSGQQFALLAAPTRSGKGVGIVIPNLLTYRESIVVLDIKQENFDLTSGFRAAHGQEIYLFNPYAEDGRTHRWNPLTYVSSNPKFWVADLTTLATIMYPNNPEGKDQFFKNQAKNTFVALGLFMLERRKYEIDAGCPAYFLSPVSFGELYRMSTAESGTLRDHFNELLQVEYLSESTRNAFSGMLSLNEEVFASVAGTFKEPLLPWLNPVVDMATAGDDFLITDVRKRRMTIYVCLPPNKLPESQLMVNLFFSQLINENTRELPQTNPELKHQCLLLMDEFTSIGRVEIIAKAVGYMAGYNLRLFPIIQSLSQLDSTYGKEDSRTLITNHALQIIYTPRLQADANEYSEMLGYRSARKGSRTIAKEGSVNIGEEKRALMLPQELRAMSSEKQVLMYESITSPILADKIRYYKDPLLKKRLYPKVEIPKLDFD